MSAERDARRNAMLMGTRLGIFQAHALAAPPLAVVAFVANPWWLALMLGIGAALGWAGWYRDFGLRWRPWNHPLPPAATPQGEVTDRQQDRTATTEAARDATPPPAVLPPEETTP